MAERDLSAEALAEDIPGAIGWLRTRLGKSDDLMLRLSGNRIANILESLSSRLAALEPAVRALMAEVYSDPERAPYPIWGPEQSQRVAEAMIAVNAALNPTPETSHAD